MATWGEFATEAPQLAEAGRRLLYQYGPGLGFLATVSTEGRPRVHPICPLVVEGGLYAFIVPSPKRRDLERSRRYALHTFPAEATDDEFYVAGTVSRVTDNSVASAIADAYHDEVKDEWRLFHFDIERALHSAYRFRGDWPPAYTKWRAAAN
jgi:hypothetical protein